MGQLLALDFDGVVNSYTSGWIKENPMHLPDPAVPGAFRFIQLAQQHFDVVIHTSRLRYDGAENALKDWFCREMMNEGWNEDEVLRLLGQLQFSVEKPPAHVTLDDRAIQFNGVFPKLDEIIDFKPWNKRNTLIEPKVPASGTVWEHTNGNLYVVYDVTNAESDRPEKFPITISYHGLTNLKRWSRPLSQWYRSFKHRPDLEG